MKRARRLGWSVLKPPRHAIHMPPQAREASLAFAAADDVVLAVPLPEVLRGELRGLSLLQTALEQCLTFEDMGCVALWLIAGMF